MSLSLRLRGERLDVSVAELGVSVAELGVSVAELGVSVPKLSGPVAVSAGRSPIGKPQELPALGPLV
jgi:hypothetical protein